MVASTFSKSVVCGGFFAASAFLSTLVAGCGGEAPPAPLDGALPDLGGELDAHMPADSGGDDAQSADAGVIDDDAGTTVDAWLPMDDAGADDDASASDDASVVQDDAGVNDDAGVSVDAGVVVGCTPEMCSDGLDCTVDRCDGDVCVHEPDNLACAAGTYCDPGMGCAPPVPCAMTVDCMVALTDPCIEAPLCDPRTRTCVYGRLDGDADGFPPPVCGGTDCNDADATAHPMGVELCDGIDDDCDGVVDAPLAAAACRTGETCTAGVCGCADTLCMPYGGWGPTECVNLQTSATHCGTCTTTCGTDATCVGGACSCAAPRTLCYGGCADLLTSTAHCGRCNNSCPGGSLCVAGDCECPAGFSYCASRGCVNLATDTASCGVCDRACTDRAECRAGTCAPDVPWFTWWQGRLPYGYYGELFDPRNGALDVAAASTSRVYIRSSAPAGGAAVNRENTATYGSFGGVSAFDVAAENTVWLARGEVSGTGAVASVTGFAPTSAGGVAVLVSHIANYRGFAGFRGGSGASVNLPSTTLDFTVFVLDASGAILSQTLYGGTGADSVTNSASRGNDLWITGTSAAAFTFGATSVPAGAWLAHFQDGALAAVTTLPVAPPQLSVAPNGSVVLGGSFVGSITFDATTLLARTTRDTDVFVVRYGADASLLSSYKLGALGVDSVGAIGAANDRALVDVTELGVSLLRDDGTVVWSRGSVDGAGLAPVFSSLLVGADGRFYGAGRGPTGFSLGGITLPYDSVGFVARLDATTGSAIDPLYWSHACPVDYCGLTRLAPIDTGSILFTATFGRGYFAGAALTVSSNTGGLLVGRTR